MPTLQDIYNQRPDLQKLYDTSGNAIDASNSRVRGIPNLQSWWDRYGSAEHPGVSLTPNNNAPLSSTGLNSSGQTMEQANDPANWDMSKNANAYTKGTYDPKNLGSGVVVNDPNKSAYDNAFAVLQESQAPVDENAIRQKYLDAVQSEIDSLNAVYAQKRAEVARVGEGKLGSVRSGSVFAGMAGTPAGEAFTSNQLDENQKDLSAVDQEKSAAIAQVLSGARRDAQLEIATKQSARTSGASAILSEITNRTTRQQDLINKNAKSLLGLKAKMGGASPSEALFSEVAKTLGVDVSALKTAYDEQDKALKAEEAKLKADQLKNNTTLNPGQSVYDENGKLLYTAPDKPAEVKHSTAYVEWQDAVNSGYKGNFNDYQNMDANRKRSITVNSSSGPTSGPIKFTQDQKNRSKALGISSFPAETQNVILNSLTSGEQDNFIRDWKAQQKKLGMSIDPANYIEEWAATQDNSSSLF